MPIMTLGFPNPKNSLTVFNEFRVDDKLPKHRQNPEELLSRGAKKLAIRNPDTGFLDMDEDSGGFVTFAPGGGLVMQSDERPKKSWWARLWARFAGPAEVEPPVPVQEVFQRIKVSQQELLAWDERDKSLSEMIQQATVAGQADMVKKLNAERGIRFYENTLYAKGHRKFLTEAQLLEFTAKVERGLCLDWVQNFVRPIPPEVIALKAKCDEDLLFDNYVVLHFDPKGTATTPEARAAEVAKRRDPILFGLLQGSRKLYFVGDWQDELCDLTFQQIVDKLGKPLEFPADPREHAAGV